jgi:predicted nucleotidyltransferase
MIKKFSIETLAHTLKQNVPEIDFALLFGSAKTGCVKVSSDIDIGVFLNVPATPEIILSIMKTVENAAQVRCDVSILNTASEILRFEALKGRVLFVRKNKMADYAAFYSLTCRQYEDTTVWMQKQLAYRGYA